MLKPAEFSLRLSRYYLYLNYCLYSLTLTCCLPLFVSAGQALLMWFIWLFALLVYARRLHRLKLIRAVVWRNGFYLALAGDKEVLLKVALRQPYYLNRHFICVCFYEPQRPCKWPLLLDRSAMTEADFHRLRVLFAQLT